jgi:GH25 family lysozyme M1 (1,4-beta-N-acetylmuramidase)
MKNGIDVSFAQGVVDWSKVKADFVFMRAGYGWDNDKQIDKQFANNVIGCEKYAIPYGVYHYSYARTPENAIREAKFCMKLMDKVGANPTLPVVFDFEEPFQLAFTAREQLDIIDAFMETVEDAGYQPMLYMSAAPLNELFDYDADRLSRWPIWVAHVGVAAPSYKGEWAVWQYTWTGKENGINGDVDLNEAKEELLSRAAEDEFAADIIDGSKDEEIKRLRDAINAYEAERNKVMWHIEEAVKLLKGSV